MRNHHVKEGLRDFFTGCAYNCTEVIKMRDIGKNIKDLRIRAKLTQEELAEKLFVTRQTVSNYENGKSRPDVDMIVKIGEILNADANTVIYGIPKEMDKAEKYRRVLILTAVLLVTSVLLVWLNAITKELRSDRWILLPFALVRYLGLPAVWMLAGWWLMDLLSLMITYKHWDQPFVRYIRIVLLCLLLIGFVILLVQVVYTGIGDYLRYATDGFELTYPSIPVLSYFVITVTYRYPMIYSFFGVAFRFIGLSKRMK